MRRPAPSRRRAAVVVGQPLSSTAQPGVSPCRGDCRPGLETPSQGLPQLHQPALCKRTRFLWEWCAHLCFGERRLTDWRAVAVKAEAFVEGHIAQFPSLQESSRPYSLVIPLQTWNLKSREINQKTAWPLTQYSLAMLMETGGKQQLTCPWGTWDKFKYLQPLFQCPSVHMQEERDWLRAPQHHSGCDTAALHCVDSPPPSSHLLTFTSSCPCSSGALTKDSVSGRCSIHWTT